MDIKRTDSEVDAVLNKAAEQIDSGGTKWRGLTYEEGVHAAIIWLLGECDDNPMDD